MGKLFTSVINTRLQKYVENNNIINEYQAGFRSERGTRDIQVVI